MLSFDELERAYSECSKGSGEPNFAIMPHESLRWMCFTYNQLDDWFRFLKSDLADSRSTRRLDPARLP